MTAIVVFESILILIVVFVFAVLDLVRLSTAEVDGVTGLENDDISLVGGG